LLRKASALFQFAGETGSFVDAVKNLKRWRMKKDGQVVFYDSMLELVQVDTCWKNGAITLATEKILPFYKSMSDIYDPSTQLLSLEAAFYPLFVT
jgi:hypothetical protein